LSRLRAESTKEESMALDAVEFKQNQRRIWAAGDYPDIATHIESAAEELVALSDVRPGQELLDVATGSGNVALIAAQAGAKVTGLDITPELFEAARRRFGEAGVEVELIEGDAEEIPFEDDSFERILSVFGVMFAPRQERATAELLRVCRPGGLIGVAAWKPDSGPGQMFKTVGSYMPPPPPELRPPTTWGDEQHVRGLFASSGADLEFHDRAVYFVDDESPEHWLEYNERVLGPVVMAKAALEPQGKWESLRADLGKLFEQQNQATDGTMKVEARYLVTLARLPS
jgi:SAM-dependent methyltransferase